MYGVARREVVVKLVAVVLFFCFAECAAGSCLNYGHACWGGHGKRSDTGELDGSPRALKTRWFLSRLIQGPPDFRILRNADLDFDNKQKLFLDEDADVSEQQPQWHKTLDVPDDQLFDDNLLNAVGSNRIRLTKVLDKRSAKQN